MTAEYARPSGDRWVPVAAVEQLELVGRLCVRVDQHDILLVRVEHEVLAVANRCPHLGQCLVDGPVWGRTIECPGHGWKFDLESGRVARHWWTPPLSRGTRVALRRYQTRVEDDEIYVRIEAPG